jgi:DNA-binding LacI/PurR family transcriptional regulator
LGRPTMSDVAKRAGVSKATVSLVINGRAGCGAIKISKQTHEKVLAAARELGYNVNVIARSMSSRRTHTLGLVTYDFGEHGPAVILGGAQSVARSQGYYLMVSSIEGDVGAIYEHIMQLDSWRVDGLFVAVAAGGDWYRQLASRLQLHIPVVWLEGATLDPALNSVGVDNLRGGELAAEHLLALGHRQVGLIAGPRQWLASQQRELGCRRALSAAGLEMPEEAVVESGWTTPEGHEAAQRLLDRSPGLTAIVAVNDQLAIGAIRALRERGYAVPEEVSVVGYDDMPLAAYVDPPLTTVRQDLAQVGRAAVSMLIEVSEGDGQSKQATITPELIVRQSTAPPH